jgi:hypothetical protein
MRNRNDENDQLLIPYLIQDSVVADSDPIQVLEAGQLYTTRRTGCGCEAINRLCYPPLYILRQIPQVFRDGRLELNRVSHLGLQFQFAFQLFPRYNSLFLERSLGCIHVHLIFEGLQ